MHRCLRTLSKLNSTISSKCQSWNHSVRFHDADTGPRANSMISFKGSRILLSIIFTFMISMNHSSCESIADLKALKDKLLDGYDKLIRPTAKGSNTTFVRTRLYPRQVIEVDEERSMFVLDSYYVMVWNDSRLQWNQTVDSNSKKLTLPSDLLWKPEISAFNSHSLSMSPTREQDVPLYLMPAGKVVWVPPIFTQTSCEDIMKSTYPYGEVKCILEMGAWAQNGWELDYSNVYLHWSEFENIHPRWEVIISKSKLVHNKIDYGNNVTDYLYLSQNFVFSLKRRPLPEIEISRNLCIFVMLITLSIFWLPPDSSTKLHLLGIQILVLIALLVYVACNTKYPLGILAAVSFVQSTMYIVVATFLLQILVISNLCNLTGSVRPPAIAMQLLTGPLGKYSCLHWPFGTDSIQLYRIEVMEEDSPKTKISPSPKDDWLLFAAGLDKLFFLFISVAMIVVHNL